MNLDGRVTIITGAGGGIGRASALEFAGEGAPLVLADLDQAALEETRAQVEAAGGSCIAQETDVTSSAQFARLAELALERFGRIDVLMNNAGIISGSQTIVEQDEDRFDQIMAVNVKGVFLGMKAVLPMMQAQRSGVVVNVSSVCGFKAYATFAAYTASKHAVIGLTRTAAAEMAPHGVRVNALCPGCTDTSMWPDIANDVNPDDPQGVLADFRGEIPLGRFGDPAEQAKVACFLASDAASFITGETLLADGGQVFA